MEKGASKGAWIVWVLAAPAMVLTATVFTLRRALSSFRLINEDFALLANSGRPYFSLADWRTWFTEGYTQYFMNFPDWPIGGYGFVRPLMNLAFYLQSLAQPAVGDRAYLLAVYVPLALTVGMLVPVFGRYAQVGPGTAGLLSVAVGLSPVWHQALVWPAIATNTMAFMFSVAAVLLLDPWQHQRHPLKTTATIACLTLAVASHETAIVASLACVALLLGLSPARPTMRDLWPFAIPFVYLILARSLLQSTGVYALEVGLPEIRGRIVRYAMSPLLPYDAQRMIFWEPPGSVLESIPLVAAALANLALLAAVCFALLKNRTKVTLWMIVAIAISASVGMLMLGEPRFMGITLVLALIVAFKNLAEHPSARFAVLNVVLLASVSLFYWGVMRVADNHHRDVVQGGWFFDNARAAVQESEPSAVVLVNDRVGFWASRAMLEAAAWPRTDVELVVLNNYNGPPDPRARLSIATEGGVLRVKSTLGPEQHLRFDGGVPDFTVANGGFTYEAVGVAEHDTPGGGFEARRPLRASDRILVIGVDPRDESFIKVIAEMP